jgi:hypothetical protein
MKELVHVSKFRSGVAFAVFVISSPLVFLVETLMGASLMHVQSYPRLPAELVGEWHTMRKIESAGVRSVEILAYSFSPERGYVFVGTTGSTDGHCTKTIVQNSLGRVAVESSELVLTPQMSTESVDDGCSGTKAKTRTELNKKVYQYQIHKRPSGWELCLSDRFGEVCLTPQKQ